jgi:polyisoprenoid-binding protein YceI
MTKSNWNIDVAHSGINFSVRHMVVSKVRGKFGKFSGVVNLDDDDLTRSQVQIAIDAASIDTGIGQRDDHLRSADFFDAAQYPELRFQSSRIERVADDRYRVVGQLTIRDTTKEVTLDVEYGGRAKDPWGNDRTGFTAKTVIDRKEFGLNWNQVLEAGGVLVGDRVEIELEVEAVKAAAAQAA